MKAMEELCRTPFYRMTPEEAALFEIKEAEAGIRPSVAQGSTVCVGVTQEQLSQIIEEDILYFPVKNRVTVTQKD